MFFGNKLRELREKKGLVLRQVAAALEVDTATMSKIERGDRQAREEQLAILASTLDTDLQELKTLWMADKIYQILKESDNANQVLDVIKEKLKE